MRSVDFVYFSGCPNIEHARARLNDAFTAIGAEPSWLEWDVSDSATPEEFRRFGSPTILINGRDVAGDGPDASGGCRLYHGAGGLTGAPPFELILEALRKTTVGEVILTAPAAPSWRRLLAVLPSLGVAAVPVGTCPVCIAGMVGVFSTLGIGFVLETQFLLPIAAAALMLALSSLAWRARSRQGYGPLGLGVAGAGILSVGQFILASSSATVLGAVVLMLAALWNAWPRQQPGLPCANCLPTTAGEKQP